MKDLLLILLTGHVLGDYYLQSQTMADQKENGGRSLAPHLAVYAIPFLGLAGLYGFSDLVSAAALAAVLLHGVIDWGKASFQKALPALPIRLSQAGRGGGIYLADQILHGGSLAAVAFWMGRGRGLEPVSLLTDLLGELSFTWQQGMQWTLALLLIARPANISFEKLFAAYRPARPSEETAVPDALAAEKKLRAGGVIGILERLLSLIFLAMGEYMAIGLILTAKSIARYDRISKDPPFAEYYLIGTLTSIIMVLIIYFLCFLILAATPA